MNTMHAVQSRETLWAEGRGCPRGCGPPGVLWGLPTPRESPSHPGAPEAAPPESGQGGRGVVLGQALRARDPGVPSSARWRSGTGARAARKTVWEEKQGQGGEAEGLRRAERQLLSWGAGHPGSDLLLVSEPGADLTCPPSQTSTLDGQKSPTPRQDTTIAPREGDQAPCGPTPRRVTTTLLQPEKAMLLQG